MDRAMYHSSTINLTTTLDVHWPYFSNNASEYVRNETGNNENEENKLMVDWDRTPHR